MIKMYVTPETNTVVLEAREQLQGVSRTADFDTAIRAICKSHPDLDYSDFNV